MCDGRRASAGRRPTLDLRVAWPCTTAVGRSPLSPRPRLRRLAQELGVSEVTASVLLRRGSREGAEARAFLDGEREPHDPLLLGDMADAVERIRAAIAAGTRICVHGDYDVDGICATALAVLTLRVARRRRRVAPAEPLRGGLRRLARHARAARRRRVRARADRRLRHHGRRGGRGGPALGPRGDRHRPPPARRRAARLPDRRHAAVRRIRSRSSAAPASSASSPRRSGAADPRHLDLVALATIADVVPLVDENRSLAIAGLRALARTSKPGLRALMRSARVDPAARRRRRGRVPARRRESTPRGGSAARTSALELLLTEDADDGEAARGRARGAEPRAPGRRGADPARRPCAQVEEWPEAQRRRRGYVLWSEDWHEGVIGIVASRLVERFGRPVVLIAGVAATAWKGSGRSIPELRPARRARRVLGAPRALRRPSRRGRALDRAGAARGVRRGLRRARRRRARRRRPAAADRGRRDRAGGARSRSSSPRSSTGSRLSASATRT